MKTLYTFLAGFFLAAGLVQSFNDHKPWGYIGVIFCFLCLLISLNLSD